jgi:hypothetical protein
VRITPFEVLEQHARKEYARRYASVPEPKYINARAEIQLDAPRSLVWGGVGYWAPPLSYEHGQRLFAVSSFLADALKQGHAHATRSAVEIAIPLFHQVLRRRRPPVRHVIARIREAAAAQRAFLHDDPQELLHLMRWLLYVEDESPLTPSEQRVTVDLIDNRYAFEGHYKRPPRSWKDYVYGMHHIARQQAREDLRAAVAARVGVNSDEKGWLKHERALRETAGW